MASFNFDFGDDELDEEIQKLGLGGEEEAAIGNETEKRSVQEEEKVPPKIQAKELKFDELLHHLPPRISYSKIKVDLGKDGKTSTIFRRDLFDARFQLLNEGEEEEEERKKRGEWSAGADSDLVPGVYEGGLKTWECSLDLVQVLSERVTPVKGKSVLELGCGTAVPCLYLFSELLSQEPPKEKDENEETVFTLCDFNEQALKLVTFPNLFLAWYFSPSNTSQDADSGEVELDDDIIDSFKHTLEARRISLRFFSGPWQGLDDIGALSTPPKDKPDVVITSETIYSLDTLPVLVDTLRASSLRENQKGNESKKEQDTICLVAAKVLYFGVGGGLSAFEDQVSRRGGRCETIWRTTKGVGRVVDLVRW